MRRGQTRQARLGTAWRREVWRRRARLDKEWKAGMATSLYDIGIDVEKIDPAELDKWRTYFSQPFWTWQAKPGRRERKGMPTTRIYEIADEEVKMVELVEAISGPQALRYVASKRYTVSVPSPKRVAQLMGEGLRLQTAGEEAKE